MSKIVDVEARRLELAGAAARVIARSGTDGASLRSVAAEAGWTTGTLAHYFTNKRELLRFTLLTSLDSRRAERGVHIDDTPIEAIRRTLVNVLPLTDDARLHWNVTVAFASYAVNDPELALVQRDAYRSFRTRLAEMVRAAAATRAAHADGSAGHADASDETEATETAERLIALLDGIALQSLFDPESWPSGRQLDALDTGLARDGLRPTDALRLEHHPTPQREHGRRSSSDARISAEATPAGPTLAQRNAQHPDAQHADAQHADAQHADAQHEGAHR